MNVRIREVARRAGVSITTVSRAFNNTRPIRWIPNEIALAGFDDIPIARYLFPPLTTVHFGIIDLGVMAVQTVLHAIRTKNHHPKQRVTLPMSLKIRESCGCKNHN